MSLILARHGSQRRGITVPPGPSYVDAVLADSPTGYWRLGDPSGTVADATVGIDGTYASFPALGQPGLLTGTGEPSNASVRMVGVDEYVYVVDDVSVNLTSPMSIECIFKPSTIPAAGLFSSLMSKDTYGFQFADERLEFWIRVGGVKKNLKAPVGAVVAGGVYHAVGTYDGTNMRSYLNGAQVTGSPVAQTGGITQNTSFLRFGTWDGTQEYFDGYLQEVAVYKSALSAARILAHYTAATT